MERFTIRQIPTSEFAKRVEQVYWDYRPKRIRNMKMGLGVIAVFGAAALARYWYLMLGQRTSQDLPTLIAVTVLWGIMTGEVIMFQTVMTRKLRKTIRKIVGKEIVQTFDESGVTIFDNEKNMQISREQIRYGLQENGVLFLGKEGMISVMIDEETLTAEEQQQLIQYKKQYLEDCPDARKMLWNEV